MRIAAALALGAIAFASAAVYFAPARLLASQVEAPMRLQQIEGRWWRGAAKASYDGIELGRLTWSFDSGALLDGRLGADWQLADAGLRLSGSAAVDLSGIDASATGVLRKAIIDRALLPYQIDADGALTVNWLTATLRHDLRLDQAQGELSWAGGDVRYLLAGIELETTLPQMTGAVTTHEGELRLNVRAADDPTPLMRVRLDQAGWAHIGITRRFTELAGLPRPAQRSLAPLGALEALVSRGALEAAGVLGPPEAIVLEVSEQLFEAAANEG